MWHVSGCGMLVGVVDSTKSSLVPIALMRTCPSLCSSSYYSNVEIIPKMKMKTIRTRVSITFSFDIPTSPFSFISMLVQEKNSIPKR